MSYPPDEWFQLSADSIAEIPTRKTGHPWIGVVLPRPAAAVDDDTAASTPNDECCP